MAKERLAMSMKDIVEKMLQNKGAGDVSRVMRYIGDVLDSALVDYQSYISQGGVDGW